MKFITIRQLRVTRHRQSMPFSCHESLQENLGYSSNFQMNLLLAKSLSVFLKVTLLMLQLPITIEIQFLVGSHKDNIFYMGTLTRCVWIYRLACFVVWMKTQPELGVSITGDIIHTML